VPSASYIGSRHLGGLLGYRCEAVQCSRDLHARTLLGPRPQEAARSCLALPLMSASPPERMRAVQARGDSSSSGCPPASTRPSRPLPLPSPPAFDEQHGECKQRCDRVGLAVLLCWLLVPASATTWRHTGAAYRLPCMCRFPPCYSLPRSRCALVCLGAPWLSWHQLAAPRALCAPRSVCCAAPSSLRMTPMPPRHRF
jgi:hypothetical protein